MNRLKIIMYICGLCTIITFGLTLFANEKWFFVSSVSFAIASIFLRFWIGFDVVEEKKK